MAVGSHVAGGRIDRPRSWALPWLKENDLVDSEAIQVTLLVTGVLDALGIPYVIGGSMASIIHGMLRTTMIGQLNIAA